MANPLEEFQKTAERARINALRELYGEEAGAEVPAALGAPPQELNIKAEAPPVTERVAQAAEFKPEIEIRPLTEEEISLENLPFSADDLQRARAEAALKMSARLPDVGEGIAPEPAQLESIPSPEPTATAEELRRVLEETRSNYIAQYREHYRSRQERIGAIRRALGLIFKGGKTPAELEMAKTQYDEAKSNLGRKLYRQKEQEFEAKGVDPSATAQELAKYRVELFEKLIVNEKRQLQYQQIEGWPPKDKTLMGKCLEWWMKQGTYKRLLITSAIMTGAFALAPFISPVAAGFASSSSALMFGAFRFGRGAIGAITGQMIGKGVEKGFEWIGPPKIWTDKEKEISEYFIPHLSLQSFKVFEEEYEDILRKRAIDNKIKNYTKWAAMWAGGYVASDIIAEIGAGWLSQFGAGVPARPTGPSAPKTPEPVFRAPTYPPESAPPPDFEVSKPRVSIPETPAGTKIGEIIPKSSTPDVPLGRPAPSIEAVRPSVAPLVEDFTINEGEGIWNPVYRQLAKQLENDPRAFAQQYGWENFDPEGLKDPTYLKDILNRQTQHILEKNNMIFSGGELRIARPGVKVLLNDDGTIKLEGGGRLAYEWTKPKLAEQPTADLKPPATWTQGGAVPDWAAQAEPEQMAPPPTPKLEEILLEYQGGGLKENVLQEYGAKPSGPLDYEAGQIANKGALGENIRRYTLDLPDKKISLLDDLVYNNRTAGAGVNELADYIKKGKLTVKDFAHYYISEESRGEKTAITEKFLKNLEDTFRLVSGGGAEEKKQAAGAIRTLLNSLRQGRPTS